MCGIAGFYSTKLSSEQSATLMEQMLQTQHHRGPDFKSIYQHQKITLGHNRLSIIDLSESANQPMTSENLTIVFNGEVYNYIEIRNELQQKGHSFSTQSDTEVILKAYKEWGENCVEKFVGMWAFCIYNQHENSLFCSRDRFGIKPFFYISNDDEFFFASEVKTLKKTPIFNSKLNEKQLSVYLQLGWFYSNEETLFESVKTLPAAHNLIFKNGKLNIKKYWQIEKTEKSNLSFDDKREHFKLLFEDAVKLHNRSDVEVGICLSGGLDSSAIASVHSAVFAKPLKSFTIFYEGKDAVDERPWVEKVLKKYPNINPFFYSPSDEELKAEFEKFVHHFDFPPAGSSPFSQYFVMKLAASKNMKVLLDGQGSDELLGGYMHSFYRLLGCYFSSFQWGNFISEFSAHAQKQSLNIFQNAELMMGSLASAIFSEKQLLQLEYEYKNPFLSQKKLNLNVDAHGKTALDKFLYQLIYASILPNLLHNEDRNSMAFSIESRVPFLDHRLAEFCFSLNDDDRINKGTTKYIMREALKNYLPEKIYNRTDKKGFVTPGEVRWLRGALNPILNEKIEMPNTIISSKVKTLVEDYKKGNNKNAKLIWRLMVLNYWLKRI